jgi:hypothetical protein
MSNNQLWAIFYVSTAMKDLSPQQVQDYLDLSRKTRTQNDITGLAILANNNVLVIQEGQKETLKHEFENERKHPAHHSMIKLYDGPISGRYFEGYALAFKTVGKSAFSSMDDFREPSLEEHFHELIQLDDVVARLMKDFIKNNS